MHFNLTLFLELHFLSTLYLQKKKEEKKRFANVIDHELRKISSENCVT